MSSLNRDRCRDTAIQIYGSIPLRESYVTYFFVCAWYLSVLNLHSKTTQKWLLWSFKYQKYIEMNNEAGSKSQIVFKSMQQQSKKDIIYNFFQYPIDS